VAASDKTIAEVVRDLGIDDTTLAAALFVKVATRENGGMLRPDHVTATFRRLVRGPTSRPSACTICATRTRASRSGQGWS
jgi:hypothetical protein